MTINLTPELLKKTTYGVIPSFADIFTGARYINKAGQENAGELFIWTEGNDLPRSSRFSPWSSLYARVSEEMIAPRFAPRIASGEWKTVPPSSVRIIPWAKNGVYLVLACDPNSIGDEWFAWVSIEQNFVVE